MSGERGQQDVSRVVRALYWLALAVVVLSLVLAAATLRAADDALGKPVASTVDAVGWALADIATMAEPDRPFARYVWIPPWGSERWISATNFAVNTAASHAQTIQNGAVIANGWMIRYDLRRLAPSAKQLSRLLATWDGLALQDPYFHVPEQNSKAPAAILSPHLRQQEAVALAGLSLSTGAVYRADFLVTKMLSTLEGGKYYDFLQVDRQVEKGTPQDAWLATLGIFEAQTKAIAGDQRTALFRSNITGKPRRIDVLFGIGRGGSLATITHDISDEDTDAASHPLRNLIAFSDSAREIIIQRPNGTHAFALTNADGQFVDSAPDNVARDHTVPAPYTSRLQPAISCIRCHGPHDGYQPFGNDVAKILSSRLDVFSDLQVDGIALTREQAVDRLAGLYAGQLDIPDGLIGRARRDYIQTCARISGGLVQPQPDVSIVTQVSSDVSEIFASYRYTPVTPEIAVAELGGAAGQTLDDLLGDPGAALVVDPIEGSLRAGIAVNRSDWEVVFADLAGKAAARAKP